MLYCFCGAVAAYFQTCLTRQLVMLVGTLSLFAMLCALLAGTCYPQLCCCGWERRFCDSLSASVRPHAHMQKNAPAWRLYLASR